MRLCFDKSDVPWKLTPLPQTPPRLPTSLPHQKKNPAGIPGVGEVCADIHLLSAPELLFSFAESLRLMCFWPLDPSSGPQTVLSAALLDRTLTAGLRQKCQQSFHFWPRFGGLRVRVFCLPQLCFFLFFLSFFSHPLPAIQPPHKHSDAGPAACSDNQRRKQPQLKCRIKMPGVSPFNWLPLRLWFQAVVPFD